MSKKPFSESCEKNKEVILGVLKEVFSRPGLVFEVGSGTGQHAVYFTEKLKHLTWQPSDLKDQVVGMKLWFDEANNERICDPKIWDIRMCPQFSAQVEYVFSANTAHFVSWPEVQSMFKGIEVLLKKGGFFAQYGPFNYEGNFTSESNEKFDQWLKDRNSQSGIRNFEDIALLAKQHGMVLSADYAMPANNRILVWRKVNVYN